MRDDQYRIHMIRYARSDRNRPANFFGGDPHDTPMPIDYFVWVLSNGARTIVVDTGFDEAVGRRRQRETIHPVGEGFRAIGLDPGTVSDVIVTHMHYDHAGNHDLLPGARYHVQDCEMAYVTGRCMCHHLLRHPFEEEDVVAMVRKVYQGRVEFHDGTGTVAPGVTVHKVGGHSRGLQIVRVETERGPVVLASDASHYYEHIENDRAFSVLVDLAELLEGYRTIRKLAPSMKHVVPGHDPAVFDRYPAAGPGLEGWAIRVDLEPNR
ncbi:MBL fold hydrolase [Prosthecomicrobium hirschii]|uniref:N-acyl homoserine lactonase family protein n=1 Tax=Prosthecodimorpha hirschii TaxID=665126 RepID=UPI00112C5C2A|nr:N-acyl homoserine lactonase family protein [Prosthecomicrobium hirschii]TPQ46547.1 MBL fold hydrolase [Prosthecomicrobium hirschii]